MVVIMLAARVRAKGMALRGVEWGLHALPWLESLLLGAIMGST